MLYLGPGGDVIAVAPADVRAQTSAGYVVVADPDALAAMPREPALEAAILADRDDLAAWDRYLAWLAPRHPERAALAALDRRDPRFAALAADPLLVPQGSQTRAGIQIDATLEHGFVTKLSVMCTDEAIDLGAAIAAALAHPAAFALREISVFPYPATAIAALVANPPKLDSLSLGVFPTAPPIGPIDDLLATQPGLVILTVSGVVEWTRPLQLPQLRELVLHTPSATPSLLQLEAPELVRARLDSASDGGELMAVLPGIAPRLRELALWGGLATDATCAALREIGYDTLELRGPITDRGARLLCALPSLARLSIANHHIVRPSLWQALRDRGAVVDVGSLPPAAIEWLRARACGEPDTDQNDYGSAASVVEHPDGRVEVEVRYSFDHDFYANDDRSEEFTGRLLLDADLNPIDGTLERA